MTIPDVTLEEPASGGSLTITARAGIVLCLYPQSTRVKTLISQLDSDGMGVEHEVPEHSCLSLGNRSAMLGAPVSAGVSSSLPL